MAASGHEGSTSFHVFAVPAAEKIFLTWSTVSCLAQVFCLFTTMVRPSKATGISMNSILCALHASTSDGLMAREALAMSVSPLPKRLKPPPVPDMPTVTLTLGAIFENSSATASAMG